MTNILFKDLGLSDVSLAAIEKMGYEFASPIQSEAIPHLLNGFDLIGQAQTGTGKTAAFGIPMIEKLDETLKGVQGIVLCPTRELAVQVAEELKKLASTKRGLEIVAVYGGDSMERQIRALRGGAQVVVGTPGRVIDHINRGTLKLQDVTIAILDEADEMLDMGFRDDIEEILQNTPEGRQSVMFSATMSKEIMNLTKKYQKDAVVIKVTKNEVTNANIEQAYFDVRHGAKMEVLCRLIDLNNLRLSLIFSNQKRKVDEIVEDLNKRGYSAEGLHGDMRQQARNATMSRFRNGQVQFLVATDVAARGIDVDNVDAVINYDMPLDPEYYVHRIGRTGRAGKLGKAFSLTTGSERNKLRDVTNYTKVDIAKGQIPSAKDIMNARQERFVNDVIGQTTTDLEQFRTYAEALINSGTDTLDLISALVKLNTGKAKFEYKDENLEGDGDRRSARKERSSSSRNERFGNERTDRGGRRERGSFDRNDRGERPARTNKDGGTYAKNDENMQRLSINIGRSEKISPSNIVGAIAGESGVPGKLLGQIDIFERHTFIDVPKGMANTILNRMVGVKIKGKRVNVEIAAN